MNIFLQNHPDSPLTLIEAYTVIKASATGCCQSICPLDKVMNSIDLTPFPPFFSSTNLTVFFLSLQHSYFPSHSSFFDIADFCFGTYTNFTHCLSIFISLELMFIRFHAIRIAVTEDDRRQPLPSLQFCWLLTVSIIVVCFIQADTFKEKRVISWNSLAGWKSLI